MCDGVGHCDTGDDEGEELCGELGEILKGNMIQSTV